MAFLLLLLLHLLNTVFFSIIQESKPIMRTDQYNSKWLNSPQFVGSFEAGDFVYFIFREAAVEHINCGKVSITIHKYMEHSMA